MERLTDRGHMTGPELRKLQEMRESGKLSFFRTAPCERCGCEVHKGMRFCSPECMEVEEMWKALAKLEGKRIEIETWDGCRRTGVLTAIQWGVVDVGGEDIKVPTGVALDDEPGDELPWHRLRWVRECPETEG